MQPVMSTGFLQTLQKYGIFLSKDYELFTNNLSRTSIWYGYKYLAVCQIDVLFMLFIGNQEQVSGHNPFPDSGSKLATKNIFTFTN